MNIKKMIAALTASIILTGCSGITGSVESTAESSVSVPESVRQELENAKNEGFGKTSYLKADDYEITYPITLGGNTVAKIEVFYISESVGDAKISLDSLDGTLHISNYDDGSDESALLGIRNSRPSLPGDSSVSLSSFYVLTNYKSEKAYTLTITLPEDTRSVMVVSANASAWHTNYRVNCDYRTKVQRLLAYGTTEESLYPFSILYDVANTVDDPASGIVPKERELVIPKDYSKLITLITITFLIAVGSFIAIKYIKKKKARELEEVLASDRIQRKTEESVRAFEAKEINDLETLVSEYEEMTESRMYEETDTDINERFSDDIYSKESKPEARKTSVRQKTGTVPAWMQEDRKPAWLTESSVALEDDLF